MPPAARPRRRPTDDWSQLRLLVASPAQEAYELLRPIVLFGQPPAVRARETGVPERTLRRKAARFEAHEMRSLFELDPPPAEDRRRLPAEVRRAIVALKAEYPAFGLREIAAICQERFERPVGHHTVKQVLTTEPLPLDPLRRFPRYHEVADPVARRRAVVTLYLDGWSVKAIAGYMETSRAMVYDILQRWDEEGWPELADRPLGPRHPAGKVDLKAMAAIRRLQANPELGEFRIHAALAQQDIHFPADLRPDPGAARGAGRAPTRGQHSSRAAADAICGATTAPILVGRYPLSRRPPTRDRQAGLCDLGHGELQPRTFGERGFPVPGPDGAPHRAAGGDGDPRRTGGGGQRQWWGLQGEPRQGHLRGVGDRTPPDRPRPSLAELHRDALQRHAPHGRLSLRQSHDLDRAADRPRAVLRRLQQAHFAHQERADGRRSPGAVLGWVQGSWCEPGDLDRLFRLRATRVLNAQGCVRFRHWRLYGERGLAGTRAAVWVWDETLTIEHAAETLAQYRVAVEADGRRLREVADPRFFTTGHASPQPLLAPLDETEWHPARRLASYRPRRTRVAAERQAPLPEPDRETASG